MEFKMMNDNLTAWAIVDTPFTILDISDIHFNHKSQHWEVFHNYWLNHKEYGYIRYIFGVFDDFHTIFGRMSRDRFNQYFEDYYEDIRKLENEEDVQES